jgi:quercetin dioxygenase-like cupin family protein
VKRMSLLLSFTLFVGVAVGIVASQFLNAQEAPPKKTELLTHDLAGIAGKRVSVYRVEIAPGVAAGKHRHPVDTIVYVLDGTLTLEQEGR